MENETSSGEPPRRQPISAARLDDLARQAQSQQTELQPYETMVATLAGAALPAEGDGPAAGRLRHQQEQAYFNDIYLLAPVGYFVLGFDTTILQLNVVGADLLGVQRAHPGRAQLRSFIAPRFLDDFDRFIRAAIASRVPEHCDLQMTRHRHHQGFPVTLRASVDPTGQSLRIVLELAEGKLAALERSEERFRRIVHAAEEGVWELDQHARTSFVNPKMARMLGYAIEDMLDQPLVSFMDAEGRNLLERNIAQRQQGGGDRSEYKFIRRDGSELWATLVTNPIFGADGAYLGALALVTDITERRASTELMWHQANFDTLTALPNRHMFQDRLAQEMKKAQREDLLLALLFIDLDGFKLVNDTLGHQQGDALLVEAASRIAACVRATDTLARLGGDEFTIILSGLDHVSAIERIAQAIVVALQRPFQLDGQACTVSASVGIALYPADAAEPDQLLEHADQAMYAAKKSGRGRYSYFTPDLQLAAQARQQAALDLRAALDQQQLELHYQPIVSLDSGKVQRAEALLRWRHPVRGLLTPVEFLPFAQSGGLMLEIGDWVFRAAARQARAWQAELGEGFQVSINQAPAQFRGELSLYQGWLDYAQELGLAPRSIVIEVAEGLLLDAGSAVAARLAQLRSMGLQVALDNFGTGYASLSHLRHFEIDYLKLDHSFVQHLATDTGDLALCEALIVMVRKLGLEVVAEGVESEAQHALLRAAGCDYGQGYYYAAALPAAQLAQLVLRKALSAGPAGTPPGRG
ncbi:putative bifunctional diguanylate cyclase/phosphodiesterase [Oxalobacteraceae bacterium A2-2]